MDGNHPTKRRRVEDYQSVDDVLDARDRNNNLLKSRLEGVIERYSENYNGVSDVIDLQTGEVQEDNGHLREMGTQRDVPQDLLRRHYVETLERQETGSDGEGSEFGSSYSGSPAGAETENDTLPTSVTGQRASLPASATQHSPMGTKQKERPAPSADAPSLPPATPTNGGIAQSPEWVTQLGQTIATSLAQILTPVLERHLNQTPASAPLPQVANSIWDAPPLPNFDRSGIPTGSAPKQRSNGRAPGHHALSQQSVQGSNTPVRSQGIQQPNDASELRNAGLNRDVSDSDRHFEDVDPPREDHEGDTRPVASHTNSSPAERHRRRHHKSLPGSIYLEDLGDIWRGHAASSETHEKWTPQEDEILTLFINSPDWDRSRLDAIAAESFPHRSVMSVKQREWQLRSTLRPGLNGLPITKTLADVSLIYTPSKDPAESDWPNFRSQDVYEIKKLARLRRENPKMPWKAVASELGRSEGYARSSYRLWKTGKMDEFIRENSELPGPLPKSGDAEAASSIRNAGMAEQEPALADEEYGLGSVQVENTRHESTKTSPLPPQRQSSRQRRPPQRTFDSVDSTILDQILMAAERADDEPTVDRSWQTAQPPDPKSPARKQHARSQPRPSTAKRQVDSSTNCDGSLTEKTPKTQPRDVDTPTSVPVIDANRRRISNQTPRSIAQPSRRVRPLPDSESEDELVCSKPHGVSGYIPNRTAK